RTMLTFTDRLGWLKLSDARQVYATTHQWLKWFLAEGLALFIFLIGNLGTRFLGGFKLITWLKNFRRTQAWEKTILGCLLASLIAPLLFIQKGTPWNSLQFFYYFLFFSGLLTALWLGEFLKKKANSVKIIILLIIIGITLPTTWGTLKHYLPLRAPSRISFDELEALDFLRGQPEGIVLTYPHDYQARTRAEAPKPLYIYETTAYVSAFANKQTFLEDEMNLEIIQVDWKPRRVLEETFFQTNNEGWAKAFLEENKIKYLYLVDNQKFMVGESQIGLKKIFENGNVRIYEVRGKI
ncbi:MAG: hypothetical protein NTV20_00680, partial [Candidatus Shapirobacteria bacterium]|nr:hypothetical protein [Candidatus Shapirobacteria bacterium]